MKQCVALICVVVGTLAFLNFAKAETITLVADEWCPYNCKPGSDSPGYLVEIAQTVFSKHGIDLKYEVLPWTRAIEESRLGKYHGILGAFKDDAPDFVFPEPEFGTSSNEFFVKIASEWQYKDRDSLKNSSLGVIQGYSYDEEFDAYVKANASDPKLIQISSGEDALGKNVKKLLAGRLDAVVEDGRVMAYHLKRHNLLEKIKSAGVMSEDNVFIAFSPKDSNSPKYAEMLSRGVKELKTSGRYQEILAKYGL